MRKLLILAIALYVPKVTAQSTNDILNVLVANQTISQEHADSLRAEAAIKQQDAEANKTSFLAAASRSIQFAGYTQVRYQFFEEESKKDGFDIRRARFDVKGNFTPYFTYRLQADFVGSPKLLDAYGEIRINEYFNITIGQFRIPFSLENLTSVNKFELINYSQGVEALAARGKDMIGDQNGRDIGIQLGGTLIKHKSRALVEYRIGVFNGSGINVADTANEAKDIAGRLIFNPFKELSFGASYYNGWGKAIKPTAEFEGESQARNRVGVEASYTTARLSIKAEYLAGEDGKTNRAGWYALAGYYVIPKKLQAIVKYDSFDPNTSTDSDISTHYVLGLNFNFNNWSRIQAFYTLREEQGTSADINYFSVQYQIGF